MKILLIDIYPAALPFTESKLSDMDLNEDPADQHLFSCSVTVRL